MALGQERLNLCVLVLFVASLAQEPLVPVDGQESQKVLSREIHVKDLGPFVSTTEGRNNLTADFHEIPVGKRKSWVTASMPENLQKNRYDDLLAYDDTRVVLDPLPDDAHSDYINANYVNGYNHEKEYVATQGPLNNTINDFWRMVWQLNSRKIIMLANVLEHGKIKVEKYWPETNQTYGDILITTLSEHEIKDHVLRTFRVEKQGDTFARVVKQFHYTGWPDMGVPQERLSVVALVQQARKYRPQDAMPIIVHCSAGVGRTGTVILMDSMMEMARMEDKANFMKRLDSMRNQRVDVVEKEAQYLFAHEAVDDVFNGAAATNYLEEVDSIYSQLDIDENDNPFFTESPVTNGASSR